MYYIKMLFEEEHKCVIMKKGDGKYTYNLCF